MTDFRHSDMQSLPKPAKGRGGAVKLGMYTLAALLITSASLYWLSRDEEDKKNITSSVKENVEIVIKDTPLQEVVGSYLDDTSPPPTSITRPQTAPGTLAGQNVQAKMSAPPSTTAQTQDPKSDNASLDANQNADLNTGLNAGQNTTQENSSLSASLASLESSSQAPAPAPSTPLVPTVKQDSKIPLTFVDDMASWLVSRYKPKSGISRNLSTANLRYGQKMHSLPQESSNVQSSRAALLRYAFNSTMMTALYNLYADHFVQSMAAAAQNKVQNSSKTILQGYAADFNTLGSVLQSLGSMDDFTLRMQAIEKSVSETLNIHNKLTEAIFAFDSAVEEKKSDVAETLQLRIDSLNAQYQRSLHNRTLATESLMAAVRQKNPAALSMDGDSILFLAQWLERRIDQGQSSSAVQKSAHTAGTLLQDLAGKLQKAPGTS